MPKHRKKTDKRRLCGTCERFEPTGREQHGPGYITAGLCRPLGGKGPPSYVHAGLACLFGFDQPPVAKSGQGDRFYALF